MLNTGSLMEVKQSSLSWYSSNNMCMNLCTKLLTEPETCLRNIWWFLEVTPALHVRINKLSLNSDSFIDISLQNIIKARKWDKIEAVSFIYNIFISYQLTYSTKEQLPSIFNNSQQK